MTWDNQHLINSGRKMGIISIVCKGNMILVLHDMQLVVQLPE